MDPELGQRVGRRMLRLSGVTGIAILDLPITFLQRNKASAISGESLEKIGGRTGARTPDPLIKSYMPLISQRFTALDGL